MKSASNVQAGRRDALLADLHEPGFALQNSPARSLSLEASALGISNQNRIDLRSMVFWIDSQLVGPSTTYFDFACKAKPPKPCLRGIEIMNVFRFPFRVRKASDCKWGTWHGRIAGQISSKSFALVFVTLPCLQGGWPRVFGAEFVRTAGCVTFFQWSMRWQSFVLRSKDTCGKREREREMSQSD